MLDNIQTISNIVSKPLPKVHKLQCCLYLAGNMASSASLLIRWKKLRLREGAVEEQRELQWKMAKLVLDLIAILNCTGILKTLMIKEIPMHIVALCSLNSAIIALYWHISKM